MRWSDVHSAVIYATLEADMVIVQRIDHPWGYEYRVRTVEDYPGTLLVRRREGMGTSALRAESHARLGEPGYVYEAEATIGRFGDRHDRAALLLEALRKQMLAFGKKRSLADD